MNCFIPPLPKIFQTEQGPLSKVLTDEGVKDSDTTVCPPVRDNPFAKARGLSPCTGGQTIM